MFEAFWKKFYCNLKKMLARQNQHKQTSAASRYGSSWLGVRFSQVVSGWQDTSPTIHIYQTTGLLIPWQTRKAKTTAKQLKGCSWVQQIALRCGRIARRVTAARSVRSIRSRLWIETVICSQTTSNRPCFHLPSWKKPASACLKGRPCCKVFQY